MFHWFGLIFMAFFIESSDNKKIKNIIKLHKGSERRDRGVVLVEGYKEVLAAMKAGLTLVEIYYCG